MRLRSPWAAVIAAGVVAGACGSTMPAMVGGTPDDAATATAARATLVAAATAGLVPHGLVIATATPDLRAARTPAEAAAALRADPRFDAVFAAVERGDVDAFLALLDLRPVPCGRDETPCAPEVPKLSVGPTSFYVSAAALRRPLSVLLPGRPLALHFASQSGSNPQRYTLVFEGPPKGNVMAPFGDPAEALGGLVVDIDLAAQKPITHLDFISGGGSALSYAYDLIRNTDQRILVFVVPAHRAP